ncbi:MAG: hypothetical protein QNJ70_10750 [Xenococcaceae cyanobacterium MO_207.B15]|nr:hypothetical protein [Xenococcaceae cyanobacterium MO_207.B15]
MRSAKLLTFTVLATGVALGAFVDSAEAQFITREGHGYSERGGDEESIFNTYILYDQKPDGQLILDNDGNLNNNRGLFIGAVEEFKSYNNFKIDPFDDDPNNDFVNFDKLPGYDFMYNIANLETRWLKDDEINSELGLKSKYKGNIIEYIISFQVNSNFKIDLLSLYILDTDLVSTGVFDPVKATNDLSYILENELIDEAIPFSVDGEFEDFGLEFIDNKLYNEEELDFMEDFRGGPKFEETIESNPVPESTSIVSLLALGAVGLSFGMKQKMK